MAAGPAAPVVLSPTEGYARWAASYDTAPNPLLRLEERTLAAWLPPLEGISVLDLGCGTGRWLQRVLVAGCAVVGVDLSAAMLAVAVTKTGGAAGKLLRADSLQLPLRDSCIDLIVCSFALEHCQELSRVAAEIARVAAPRARVLVTQLHTDAWQQGWRCRFQHEGGVVEVAANPYSLDQLCAVFARAGLHLLRWQAPRLGEPERPIFAAAGRLHAFADACRWPAILLCEFRREAA